MPSPVSISPAVKMAKGDGAERKPDDELVDLIFSWSLQDVMNQDLFKDKV
jgi:hypothetical protein